MTLTEFTLDQEESWTLDTAQCNEYQNELNAILDVSNGLQHLATRISMLEESVNLQFPQLASRCVMGASPELIWIDERDEPVAAYFQWYSVSAKNLLEMVLALRKRTSEKCPTNAQYLAAFDPLVTYRDKVGAHAAWTQNSRQSDNRADKRSSSLPFGLCNGLLVAVPLQFVVIESGNKPPTKCKLQAWSITDVHRQLTSRYHFFRQNRKRSPGFEIGSRVAGVAGIELSSGFGRRADAPPE